MAPLIWATCTLSVAILSLNCFLEFKMVAKKERSGKRKQADWWVLSELGRPSTIVTTNQLRENSCIHFMPLTELFVMDDLYVCIYINIYTCIYIYTYVCIYECMYVYTHTHKYVCIFIPQWEIVSLIFLYIRISEASSVISNHCQGRANPSLSVYN